MVFRFAAAVSLGADDNASPAGLGPSRSAAPAVAPTSGLTAADPPRVPAERPGEERPSRCPA